MADTNSSKWKAFSNSHGSDTVPAKSLNSALSRPGDIISALSMFTDKELMPRFDNIEKTLQNKESTPEILERLEALNSAKECSKKISQAAQQFFDAKQQKTIDGLRSATQVKDSAETVPSAQKLGK